MKTSYLLTYLLTYLLKQAFTRSAVVFTMQRPILSAEYRFPLLAKTDPPCSIVSLR